MPNRIIKESITTSCEVDSLSAEEERFFYRLIVVCDDYGRIDARPSILRAKCFPLKIDTIKDKDVMKWMDALKKQRLIVVYHVNGKNYIEMNTWSKHQQIRAKHSKYPAPDNGVIANDSNCNQEQANVPENREYDIREYEKRIYGDFEESWNLYPRKLGKGNVSKTQKEKLHKIGKDHIKRCIERFIKQMEKERRPIEKYPYGSTFFNTAYIDYLDENYNGKEGQSEDRPYEYLLQRDEEDV